MQGWRLKITRGKRGRGRAWEMSMGEREGTGEGVVGRRKKESIDRIGIQGGGGRG